MLGGGPGGYTAAFRAADLGLSVALIDRGEQLGGVCLNVGCIPSKALLHVAKVLTEAHELGEAGISFGEPTIDVDKVREWKNGVVGRLTGGLEALAKQRKVAGRARHGRVHRARTRSQVGDTVVGFEHCIIASGSEAASLPFLPEDAARSSTPPARSRSRASRSGCWSSAAASSASRWRRSTTRSAPR